MTDYGNIPGDLKQLRRWVNFMLYDIPGKDKPGKAPINPNTLRGAMSNNPATWGSYDQALKGIGRAASATITQKDPDGKSISVTVSGKTCGIGFELGAGYFGTDLDDVLNDQGELDPDAADIVNTLNSYTEISFSGTGVHVLCCGNIPAGRRRRGKVEMYGEASGTEKGRFFVVTGNVYGEPRPLAERTEAAASVHAKYLQQGDQGDDQKDDAGRIPQHGEGAPGAPIPTVGSIGVTAEELSRRLYSAIKTSDPTWIPFQELWRGDFHRYTSDGAPDHSKGDEALCRDLARLTGGDYSQIDQLFRQSGMYRGKWDEMRGATTYGDLTIKAAQASYKPGPLPYYIEIGSRKEVSKVEEVKAADTATPITPGTVDDQTPSNGQTDMPTMSAPDPDNMLTYMQRHFQADRKRYAGQKVVKSGFAYLDKVTDGLMPGFYLLGAVSGWGKTTFCLQLADQIAAQGQHVLYFALEQNKLELVAKSLTRITAQIDPKYAVQSQDIRKGEDSSIVKQARQHYCEQIAPRMRIIDCGFDSSVVQITAYVQAFMDSNPSIKPVVIIDYLQAIQTDTSGIREGVEEVLKQLKVMQSQHELVLILPSLLNRANYLYPIDFTSFKETGKLEATADVAWGLQLQCLTTDAVFEKDDKSKITEKRKTVDEALDATPRKMELVAIKTRQGARYKCGFHYFPQFDLFRDDDEYNARKGKKAVTKQTDFSSKPAGGRNV